MATQILALGTSAASSEEFTVTADVPVTVFGVAGVDVPWTGQLQIKSSAGDWVRFDAITNFIPVRTIYGPGTYRIGRPAGGGPVSFERS